MRIGEIMDTLKLEEEITNVELKDKLLLVFQNLKPTLSQLNNDIYIHYFIAQYNYLNLLNFYIIIIFYIIY
jgi:hypothetical protein